MPFVLLSVSRRALVTACRGSFHSPVAGCRTSELCLRSADWPCADHMHSPKKKNNSLAIHTKLSVCSLPLASVPSGDIRETLEKGEDQRRQYQTFFLHDVED
ncbi:unnamed protein product [Staurois parvus]|uniref:Secreted protein n=1 Tax=Staurois parvus TaxID=386267 RepID=A0ABN9GSC1_9NEOB|nr:unnamed protein product [Staurois parvus]